LNFTPHQIYSTGAAGTHRVILVCVCVCVCVCVEMTGDCLCPCGESTAKVTTRDISTQYTDQAMGWAIGGPGLDSQGRQRFLFAGGSGLALVPTKSPSR